MRVWASSEPTCLPRHNSPTTGLNLTACCPGSSLGGGHMLDSTLRGVQHGGQHAWSLPAPEASRGRRGQVLQVAVALQPSLSVIIDA